MAFVLGSRDFVADASRLPQCAAGSKVYSLKCVCFAHRAGTALKTDEEAEAQKQLHTTGSGVCPRLGSVAPASRLFAYRLSISTCRSTCLASLLCMLSKPPASTGTLLITTIPACNRCCATTSACSASAGST